MLKIPILRPWLLLPCAALALAGCTREHNPSSDQGDGPLADAPKVPLDVALEGSPGDGLQLDSAVSVKLCVPLPKPTGTVIKVKPSQSTKLPSMVKGAAAGTTFMLEDGTYTFTGGYADRGLFFTKPNVTLRSASGVRSKVIIDGEYKSGELIYVAASGVTIADLTIKGSKYHAIHVAGDSGQIKNTRLHNLHILDSRQQLVKINPKNGHYADHGSLDCSVLELTTAGRKRVDQVSATGCYTGGIDGHAAWGWKVRRNTFKGLFCNNGKLAEHAVHFWSTSRDTLVERNVIIDCARGIGFGMKSSGTMLRTYPDKPYPQVTGYLGHIDGIIRNNLIHGTYLSAKAYDTGIEISQNPGVKVYHNTIVTKPLYSSIDYRFANTNAEIRNNLLYRITRRNGAKGTADHNLVKAPASLFVSLPNLNYRLKATAAAAIDKGVAVGVAGGLDLDGKAHDKGPPDLGAYEYRP